MTRGGTTGPRLRRSRRGPSRRWMLLGACLEAPDLPWLADRASMADTTKMRAVCAACPVRHHCADYADAAGIVGGFWAGRARWDVSAQIDRVS
ncbi:WhiB family transcriptional regulator [Nocardioides thalensis]|uniref:WhiB family transcriptional regulator n=1 Tax=Nocardioides thalensis TaxID=1914755 RepID=UPI003CCCD20C